MTWAQWEPWIKELEESLDILMIMESFLCLILGMNILLSSDCYLLGPKPALKFIKTFKIYKAKLIIFIKICRKNSLEYNLTNTNKKTKWVYKNIWNRSNKKIDRIIFRDRTNQRWSRTLCSSWWIKREGDQNK